MALAKYIKAAGERKRYQIDYTNWLDTGEKAAAVTFTVLNNTATTPLIIDGVAIPSSGLTVQYYVAGGVDGITYNVLATMTSNSTESQIKNDALLFTIKEP